MKKFTKKHLKDTSKQVIWVLAITSFMLIVLTLGIVYAAEHGTLTVSGTAYFVSQGVGDTLPVFPVADDEGDYFNFTTLQPGTNLVIEEQYYENNNMHLTLCKGGASNNGNQTWTMIFTFMNPTTVNWTNGRTSYANLQGNNNFAVQSLTTTPTTLIPGATATVTFSMRGQLGKPDTRGSVEITAYYSVENIELPMKIYFEMVPATGAKADPRCLD